MDPKCVSCSPPDLMVCYRTGNRAATAPTNHAQHQSNAIGNNPGIPLHQSKSRELRASIMYTGCDCEKRNGLQDDCQRSECRGSPACLTKPKPTCGPSEFSNGKHLEMKTQNALARIAAYEAANNSSRPAGSMGATGGGAVGTNVLAEYQCYEAIVVPADSTLPTTHTAHVAHTHGGTDAAGGVPTGVTCGCIM